MIVDVDTFPGIYSKDDYYVIFSEFPNKLKLFSLNTETLDLKKLAEIELPETIVIASKFYKLPYNIQNELTILIVNKNL